VIIQDGIRRMYQEREDRFYYIALYNEELPPCRRCRRAAARAFSRGSTSTRRRPRKGHDPVFGSGPILNEALRAQGILAEKYGVEADVWSVTSYNELRREALANRALESSAPGRAGKASTYSDGARGRGRTYHCGQRLHEDSARPTGAVAHRPAGDAGHGRFGRSDNREHLRRHFEVNAESIAGAALSRLAREGKFDAEKARAAVRGARREYGEGGIRQ